MSAKKPQGAAASNFKRRQDSLYLMLLGTAVFVLFGFALEQAAPVSTADFRLMYFSARCLLSGHDPYSEIELRRIYHEEGGETARDTEITRKTETQYLYPPTAFSITIPFGLLPFRVAQLLWLLISAGSMILAAFLMWEVSAEWAPLLAGTFIGFTLLNCELFIAIAGPAGIAIGFCVAACWCFIRRRFEWLGVLGLAVSLILKPHDAALVWLFFLLAGGVYRKRAWQVLLAVIALSVPPIIMTSLIAPHWIGEFLSNLAANGAHGSLSDPGAASSAGHGIVMIISLQTVFSFFIDNPAFYNWASYAVCGPLLIFWMIKVYRTAPFGERAWLALAPATALSMLPVYHRLDDAKVLLLIVPACAYVLRSSRAMGRRAAVVTGAQIVLTCALPWAIFLEVIKRIPTPASDAGRQLLVAAQVMPAPLILLCTAAFYLHTAVKLRALSASEDAV